VSITPICEVQGTGLWSPLVGKVVTVQGVVTGCVRRGFFIQSPKPGGIEGASDAIFVYSPDWEAWKGALLEVTGEVCDYTKDVNSKPVTQLKLDQVRPIKKQGPTVNPIKLTADNMPSDGAEIAVFLNSLEGMLLSIGAGNTFIAPSNPFGDYVIALDVDQPVKDALRSPEGGVLMNHSNPQRWYPGFRITDYRKAPRVNVGAKLLAPVVGPLNYRVEAYQLAVDQLIETEEAYISLNKSNLTPVAGSVTIMTLNCFNLDKHIESPERVQNPNQDVDDDWGEGRFHALARAIVLQAGLPDIIALQEIQDNDGAEITEVVDAADTYNGLIATIKQLSKQEYKWVDIAPVVGADGGQPGGNIRNGYLYNPNRIEMLTDSVRIIGMGDPAYDDSRKPLITHFKERHSGAEIACVNVHLASKRHQNSLFAPEAPGHDAKLSVRVKQAELIRDELLTLQQQGINYYVTGDFNDTEESDTLQALLGDESVNLVDILPEEERYDYNHRGKLQVLMHGIVSKNMDPEKLEYEIIHGNELIGVEPGELSDKASDHAYVIARIGF